MTEFPLPAAFEQMWGELEQIGRAPSGGYHRLSWTPVDLHLRSWFEAASAARGMTCSEDRNGNQWAWLGEPSDDAVVTGSHLDSVPGGGAFDGPLGIVSGFLALDLLRARGGLPARPIAVVNFTEEEGGRFGVPCLGSRLLTGALDPAAARTLRDSAGVTLSDAMLAAGRDPLLLGPEPFRGSYVELHIEQGRRLDVPVGVATSIWPHGRWRFHFTGEANHAGTTALAERRDPVVALAGMVLAAREVATRAGALATVGRIAVEPGATNAIAGAADAWLDCRAHSADLVTEVVAAVSEHAHRRAAENDVGLMVTAESVSPAVEFGAQLRDRIAGVLAAPTLPTGAGHDAGVLASTGVPSAMLFVRNPSGVSHSPAETATFADCLAGVEALALVLQELAG